MHHNARPKDRDVTIATRRTSTAKIIVDYRHAEGEPADFFQCCLAAGWQPPKQNVVLYARVSTRQQYADGNHLSQLTELRAEAERLGLNVVGEIVEVKSGSIYEMGPGYEEYRSGLFKALMTARRTDAFILACDVSRLLRHPCFHAKTKPNARPTKDDLRELSELAGDVVMVTILEPDAPPSIERGTCRRRGQQYRQRTGGRPRKKQVEEKEAGHMTRRYREKFEPCLRAYAKLRSLREVSKLYGVPHTTLARWKRSEAAVPFLRATTTSNGQTPLET